MRLIHKPKSIPLIYQIERCWMKVLLVAVWLFYFLVSVFLVAFCVSLFVCLLSNEYWKWEELRLVCKFLVYTHMVLWITPLSLSFTFLYFWHVSTYYIKRTVTVSSLEKDMSASMKVTRQLLKRWHVWCL